MAEEEGNEDQEIPGSSREGSGGQEIRVCRRKRSSSVAEEEPW